MKTTTLSFLPASLLVLFAVSCCSTELHAALLPIHPTNSVLAGGEFEPVGGTVIDTMTIPFVAPTFSGSLKSEVIAGDLSNPYGGLTFTYLLTNDLTSPHALGRLTINDFTGFLTDASYGLPNSGTFPISFDRFNASTVGVSFNSFLTFGDGPIAPGDTSALIVIQTNSPIYTTTTASVINGSTGSALAFAPIPEPSICVAAGLGLLFAGWSVRRRRAQH